MTDTEALDILKRYNAWRRGDDCEMLPVADVGLAIDVAIEVLTKGLGK